MHSGIWSLLYLGLEVLGIVTALHAVWFVRSTQAVVAWVVGLVVFPIIGVPLYWIFGRYRFYGYREALREVGLKHKRSVSAINRELRTRPNSQTTRLHTPLEHLADVLDTPISHGNQFELLVDGEAFYAAVIRLIESAERYIYLEFYTVRHDVTGRRLAEALIAKARQGIVVRLVYDELGSIRLSWNYLRQLTSAGIDVRPFNTQQGWFNRFQINFRNHRKLVVVDGRAAIVGGLNVGDEYLGRAAWIEGWRDSALVMRGPIAKKVQAVFAGDYYWSARRDLEEADWDVPDEVDCGLFDLGRAIVCATGPADKRPLATMMFATAASSAQRRLWISTPYLVPDETLTVALSMARSRGVDVRIMIPSVADVWPVYLAGFHYARELQEADIRVVRFAKQIMMHQKCVLVDDQLALIGSTNLDIRSLHLNFELMIGVEEPQFVNQVAELFKQDLARSRPLEQGLGKVRWLTASGRVIARLFSPIL